MSPDVWLETELPSALPAFLPKQRWFGGKARKIQSVGFEDAAWLGASPYRYALTVAGLRYADGVSERYAMLLAFVDDHAGLPVVGRYEQSDSPIWVVEAATDAGAALALLQGFVSTGEIPMQRGGSLRYGDISKAATRALTDATTGRSVAPIGTEQSNSSFHLGDTLVFKLFRKLTVGENPDLEVGRFLTARTTFRAMPALRGSLAYVSARGESSTLGVLQDWIENRGDGWTHVVALLREPTAVTKETLLRDLFALGVTTAGFHAALASDTAEPAFAPEPVTAADVHTWQALLLERTARTFRLVERNIQGWAQSERRLGEAVLDLRGRASALAETPELTGAGGFQKIRLHGDYHLGQTLRTSDGFILIDFEGEPTRTLAERRLKHCALKDVAGMIRSFDYAIEAAGGRESAAAHGGPSLEYLRASFLDGYLPAATAHRAAYLPRDRHAIGAWIDFFEMEKAVYEVEYEINNRPAWLGIPLRGILRILRG